MHHLRHLQSKTCRVCLLMIIFRITPAGMIRFSNAKLFLSSDVTTEHIELGTLTAYEQRAWSSRCRGEINLKLVIPISQFCLFHLEMRTRQWFNVLNGCFGEEGVKCTNSLFFPKLRWRMVLIGHGIEYVPDKLGIVFEEGIQKPN